MHQMRTRAALTVLLWLCLAPTIVAESVPSSMRYRNLCTTGALRACASTLVYTSTSSVGTRLIIKFRNDQGGNYGYTNTGWAALRFMSVTVSDSWIARHPGQVFSEFTGFPLLNYDYPGVIRSIEGSPQNLGFNPQGPYSGFQTTWGYGYINDDMYWFVMDEGDPELAETVYGCDVGPIPPWGALRTCASQGYNGWLVVTFETLGHFTVDDIAVRWDVKSEMGGRGGCTMDALGSECVTAGRPPRRRASRSPTARPAACCG
jgi:hypothetical protein